MTARKILPMLILAVAGIILFSNFSAAHSGPASEKPRILFISSYHPGYQTFFDQTNGILSVFPKDAAAIDMEFMDTKRFGSLKNLRDFQQRLAEKLKSLPPYDVVLLGDDAALVFGLANQDHLFPGTPLIFFGVNDIDRALAQNANPLATGVIEAVSVEDTIAVIPRLHPGVDTIYAIVDGQPPGQDNLKLFRQAAARFPGLNLKELSLRHLTFEELGDRLETLDAKSAVLVISSYTDRQGRSLDLQESLDLMKAHTSRPLYSLWQYGIGSGVIGGRVVSHFEQARSAGAIARKVLDGQTVSSFTVDEQSPNRYLFDYQELQRLDVRMPALPEGATVINRPSSFYRDNKHWLWPVSLVFLILLAFMTALLINIARRKRAETALKESETRFRSIAESVREVFWIREGERIVYISPAVADMFGMPPETFYQDSKAILTCVHDADKDRVRAAISSERDNGGGQFREEYRIVRSDGSIRWIRARAFPSVLPEPGQPVIGIAEDITEYKTVQETLARQEALLAAIIESTGDGLLAMGNDGGVLYYNRKYLDIWNIRAEHMESRTRRDMLEYAAEQVVNAEELLQSAKTMPSLAEPFSGTIVFKDGRIFSWYAAPIMRNGERIGRIHRFSDITLSKLYESALKEANIQLRATLSALPDLLFEVDLDGRVLDYTAADLSKLYVQPEQFLNRTVQDVLPKEAADIIHEAIYKAVETGHHQGARYSLTYPDGARRWFELSLAAKEPSDGGRPTCIVLSREVTDRKRHEEALLRLATIVESSPDAIISTDRDGRIISWNGGAQQIYGYTASEIIGQPFARLFPDELTGVWEDAARQVLDGERPDLKTVINLTRDGAMRHMSFSLAGLKGADEEGIAGISVIARDITDRVKTAEQVRFQAMILDQIQDQVTATDLKGNIVYVNEASRKSLKRSRDELIGRHVAILGESAQLGVSQNEIIGETLRRGSWRGEVVNYASDGTEIVLDCRTRLIYGPDGRPRGICGVSTDITARHQAQKERNQLESQLRQSQKMEAIGTLSGGIAHDFNNILGGIFGYAQLAAMDLGSEEKVRRYLDNILNAAERARDLVKQILTFSRRNAQEFQAVQLAPLVKEAARFLRSTIPTTIEIRQNIEAANDWVHADPTQLHQVVMNLATNAAYAMKNRGGTLTIGLHNETAAPRDTSGQALSTPVEYLCLSVSDTGSGIPLDIQDRIFDPYFTTKPTGEGTGLGLSVIHGIVISHKGFIQLDSREGEGASFKIYLPVHSARKDIPMQTGKDGLIRGSGRILFVDDEEDLVRFMEQVLRKLGYDPVCTTSPTMALEAFKATPGGFDLMITDLTMPGMTGLELAAEVKKAVPSLPVLLCTGFGSDLTDEAVGKSGVSRVLMKPVSIPEVASAVSELLKEKQTAAP